MSRLEQNHVYSGTNNINNKLVVLLQPYKDIVGSVGFEPGSQIYIAVAL